MNSHTHHLGNIASDDLMRYVRAIAASGRDILIRPGQYGADGVRWSEDGASLWCDLLEGDLSEFWALVEPE